MGKFFKERFFWGMFCAGRFLKGGSGGTFLEGLISVGRLGGKFCALRYYGPFYVEVLRREFQVGRFCVGGSLREIFVQEIVVLIIKSKC